MSQPNGNIRSFIKDAVIPASYFTKDTLVPLVEKSAAVIVEKVTELAPVIIEKVTAVVPVIVEKVTEATAAVAPTMGAPLAAAVGSTAVVGTALHKNYQKLTGLHKARNKDKIKLEKQKKDEEIKLNHAQNELRDKTMELKETNIQIAEQEENLFEVHNVNNNANIKFIVLLGITGDGKSTLGNRLLGDKSKKGDQGAFKAENSGAPVTSNIEHKRCSINHTDCVIVDTPGKNDKNDIHNKNNLVKYLYGCGGVSAFILVKNGTNSRFDSNLACIMKEYEKDFGIHFWNHLIIVFTRIEGDEFDEFDKTKKGFTKELNKQLPNSKHAKIPVIPIGRKLQNGKPYDFDLWNKCFIKIVNKTKLECDNMVSPINELRSKRNTLKKRIKSLENNINALKNNIQNIKNEIQDIDEKINNGSYWVLGRDIND